MSSRTGDDYGSNRMGRGQGRDAAGARGPASEVGGRGPWHLRCWDRSRDRRGFVGPWRVAGRTATRWGLHVRGPGEGLAPTRRRGAELGPDCSSPPATPRPGRRPCRRQSRPLAQRHSGDYSGSVPCEPKPGSGWRPNGDPGVWNSRSTGRRKTTTTYKNGTTALE